jgi:hypothetical protein
MKKIINKIRTVPCAIVFVSSLIVWFLLTYKILFYSRYTIIGIIFVLTFSTTITCMIRNTKEKVVQAKQYKKSLFGIIWVVIGVWALQVCGINAFMCWSTIWISVIWAILPTSFINILGEYSIYIIILSIVTQIVWLYYMKCFK